MLRTIINVNAPARFWQDVVHQRAGYRFAAAPVISVSGHIRSPFVFQLNSAWSAAHSLWQAQTHQADLVISHHRTAAVWYELFAMVRRPPVPHLIAHVLVPEPKPTLRSRLFYAVKRRLLGRVECVVCHSRTDARQFAQWLGVPADRFVFLPLRSDPIPGIPVKDEGYLFSGGFEQRDFGTLVQALDGLHVPAHIITARALLPDSVPPFVHHESVVPQRQFRERMAAARLIVIPLHANVVSSGQTTLVDALSLGKPVIVSDVPGVRDYVHHGVNGWLVPPGDVIALRSAIRRLWDTERERYGLAAGASASAVALTWSAFGDALDALSVELVARSVPPETVLHTPGPSDQPQTG